MAGDGPNGLWMATEFPYGALVLDVMLPGFDGFELCRRLREAGIWTPVPTLTARDEVGDRVRGLDVGADDYLVKPFSLLADSPHGCGPSPAAMTVPAPAVLAVGDLRLDPSSKRAWRGDNEQLQLSPKEFSLLRAVPPPPRCRAHTLADHRGGVGLRVRRLLQRRRPVR